MTDQYDTEEKARDFDLFKKNFLVATHIEQPSIKKLLGPSLKGKRVIDLACGGGDSTRFLADLYPDELVGADLSSEMVRLAIKRSNSEPKYSYIKFYVRNCLEPINLGQFDVVFSVHLLNYAYAKSDLIKFYQNMYDSTKEGGVCCGLLNSPFINVLQLTPGLFRKYGTEYTRNADNINQDVDFFFEDKHLFKVHGCVWPSEYHEECARKVGFKTFKWVQLTLDENYKDDEGFFDIYLNINPTVLFKLTK